MHWSNVLSRQRNKTWMTVSDSFFDHSGIVVHNQHVAGYVLECHTAHWRGYILHGRIIGNTADVDCGLGV
jgi:hypothetical protein